MRLDLAVARRFGLARRAAREAVRSGRVDVDGETQDEPGAEVAEDARVELFPDRPARRTVRTRLAVLHEDDDVIVVDKPAGLLTVPTEARERDTLWSRVLQYLQLRRGGRPYAGIVHRLDKDTSGAVVFARNRRALHALQDRFRRHDVDREYVALAEGRPPDAGTFDADLVRTRDLRRSVARPGESGRRAVTRFQVLERLRDAALVSIRPETGRTHQIRVHFSAAGHPILGDRVYGARERDATDDAPRQMLHARRLGFALPERARVSAESPLPDDFRRELEARRIPGGAAPPSAPAAPGRERSGRPAPRRENRPKKKRAGGAGASEFRKSKPLPTRRGR